MDRVILSIKLCVPKKLNFVFLIQKKAIWIPFYGKSPSDEVFHKYDNAIKHHKIIKSAMNFRGPSYRVSAAISLHGNHIFWDHFHDAV